MKDNSQIVFELIRSDDKKIYKLIVSAPEVMTHEEFLSCLRSFLLDEDVDETVDTIN